MNRDEARQEIRKQWRSIIVHYTSVAKKKVNGKETYICPFCGHGTNGDGIKDNPKSPDGNGIKCFGACGFSGDILDFIQQATGADYSTALSMAAADLGITIDPYQQPRRDYSEAARAIRANQYDIHNLTLNDNSWMNDTPNPPARNAQNAAQGSLEGADDKTPAADTESPQEAAQDATEADDGIDYFGDRQKARQSEPDATGAAVADYSEYYEQCARNLSDPAAVSYLQARGISTGTAAAFGLGYDPAWISPTVIKNQREKGSNWKPAPTARLILPVNKNHYVSRAISPDITEYAKMNETGGGEIGIFNTPALYGQQEAVFVTEGIFDALSIIECGAAAVALNSTSNAGKLIAQLKQKPPTATLILCLDNDDGGKKAVPAFKKELPRLNISYITADLCSPGNDPNDELISDREGFEKAIADALDRAKNGDPLPGLLTYSDAVNVFETADDKFLELKSFPTFSKAAKIQTHNSVIIAADTGAGKSSLALNFLNELNESYPCIYLNLEMDSITVLRRLTAIQSGMELDRIEGYKHDEQTAAAVNITLQAITSRKPLQVIQGAYMLQDIEEIIARSTAGREEPTLVFIDHSLLVDTQERTGGRYDRFTQVSESLRKMALRYNVIMFILLQQNRSGKADESERPKNSSLKESGSWENDSTHIVFLWYDPIERKKKLLLTKNRGGGSGSEFSLNYWAKTQTYTEAAGAATAGRTAGGAIPNKQSKRERQRQKLVKAYETAYFQTFGKPTLQAIAEAADVTTSTVKTWLKEYGGFMVDGQQIDPAGIDAIVEQQEFIKLTPADNNPFDDPEPATPTAGTEQDGKRRIF